MRDLADARGRWIGSAVAFKPLKTDWSYRRTAGRQFDILTPENEMKFSNLHPRPGSGPASYDFSKADAIVAFASKRRMRVRGHTLVWHREVPDWVLSPHRSLEELAAILRDHIETVVRHYRGKVYSWDVVNEALNWDGSRHESPWSAIGPDYIERAFRWARAADPDAKLFYNDYDVEASPAKADAVFSLLKKLKEGGVPIDGVGLQFHLRAERSYGDLAALLRRYAALGLEVDVTEIDVALGDPSSPAQLDRQAALYAEALKACLDEPACKAYVMWGFSDKYSWQAPAAPDILDGDLRPKPAAAALRRVFLQK